jgi:hypothetical protein
MGRVINGLSGDRHTDNQRRRRRYQTAQRALYDLVDMLDADGHYQDARSLERYTDNLGEFVPDVYAGRTS